VIDPSEQPESATASPITNWRSFRENTNPIFILKIAILGFLAFIVMTVTSPLALGATWTAEASLNVARLNHSVTTLPNGTVLVAGGDQGPPGADSGFLDSFELYYPTANTWTLQTNNLPDARCGHTATLLANGNVLIVGGNYIDPITSSEVECPYSVLYDSATGSVITSDNLVARQQHAAILLNSGQVLVVGGYTDGGSNAVSSSELYDPGTNTWTAAAQTAYTWADCGIAILSSGEVMVYGGDGSHPDLCEIYDPTSNTWSVVVPIVVSGGTGSLPPWGSQTLNAITLSDGDVQFCASLYDPTTNQFTGEIFTYNESIDINNDATIEIMLPQLLNNGNGFAITYSEEPIRNPPAMGSVYLAAYNTWVLTLPLLTDRNYEGLVLLNDGRVLVVGGVNPNNYAPLSSCEAFDPTTAVLQPLITSSLLATISEGEPFTYATTAVNAPTSYSATVLPTGLSIDTSTGVVSGTPSGMLYNMIITATNSAGSDSVQVNFNVVVPVPTISGVNPSSGVTFGGTTVTISGTGLTGTSGVTFGGVAATSINVLSDSSVTCVTPAEASGLVNVVLTTPGGTVTSTGAFTYQQTLPSIIWSNPSAITYGTALSSTQLDATASVPGTFVYTPSYGTVLGVGANQSLSVTFSPTDTVDYSSATDSVSLAVNTASLTITANSQQMTAGSPVPTLTARYAGFVNGDTVASLTTPAVLSTTATSSSPAAAYPITVSGATDPNYGITFVPGAMIVNSNGSSNALSTSSGSSGGGCGLGSGASALIGLLYIALRLCLGRTKRGKKSL